MTYSETNSMSTSAPKVSVLVSCYNVAKYIPGFIKNISEQTYKDFELIIVDDGSKDSTFDLLIEQTKNLNNTKVVAHEQNMGLGAARNTGLRHASGKYIYFCDVDDYVQSNLLEYCVSVMESNGMADYMIFGFDASYPDSGFADENVVYEEKWLRSKEEIKNNYIDHILLCRHGNGFVWNKFYRRSFLESNNLKFGTQKIQQDEVFNIKVIQSASCIYISPENLYKYNIFAKGNNGARYIGDRFEIFVDVRDEFESLLKKWNLKNHLTDSYLNGRFYGNIMKCLVYDLNHQDCPFNSNQKRKRFYEIISHPYSKEVKSYFKANRKKIRLLDRILLSSTYSYTLFRFVDGAQGIAKRAYKTIWGR